MGHATSDADRNEVTSTTCTDGTVIFPRIVVSGAFNKMGVRLQLMMVSRGEYQAWTQLASAYR